MGALSLGDGGAKLRAVNLYNGNHGGENLVASL